MGVKEGERRVSARIMGRARGREGTHHCEGEDQRGRGRDCQLASRARKEGDEAGRKGGGTYSLRAQMRGEGRGQPESAQGGMNEAEGRLTDRRVADVRQEAVRPRSRAEHRVSGAVRRAKLSGVKGAAGRRTRGPCRRRWTAEATGCRCTGRRQSRPTGCCRPGTRARGYKRELARVSATQKARSRRWRLWARPGRRRTFVSSSWSGCVALYLIDRPKTRKLGALSTATQCRAETARGSGRTHGRSCASITRWTIGMLAPRTLKTVMSPTANFSRGGLVRKRMSPL